MDPVSDTHTPNPRPIPSHTVPETGPASAQGPPRIYRLSSTAFADRCHHIPTTSLNLFERERVQLRYYELLKTSVYAGCDRVVEDNEVFAVKEGGKEAWYIQRSIGTLMHTGQGPKILMKN